MEIIHEKNQKKMFAELKRWHRGELAFHWHEKIEIVRCLNHRICILMDGVEYMLQPGDICVIGGQTIHKFTILEDETDVFVLQLPYEILLKSDVEIQPIQRLIRSEDIRMQPKLFKTITDVLEILEREDNVAEGGNNAFLNHLYAGLYCLLMQAFPAEAEDNKKREQKARNVFYCIVGYVNEHFTEHINVQSVAGALFLDRGRLSALFLKYAGISLHDYINALRLVRVKQLTEEGMNVTQAALESGF